MRRFARILLNAATVACLTPLMDGCRSHAVDPPPVQVPESFIRSLRDSTAVEFNHDSEQLARMSDAEFEDLLAAYRSVATSAGASAAAVDTATARLRQRRREAMRAAPGRRPEGERVPTGSET